MMKEYIDRKLMNEVLDELCVVNSVWNVLNDIPAADVKEVIRAKWERKEYNSNYPYYRMECSNCGGRMPRDQFTKEYYSSYCPHCGAKMDLD